TVAIALGACIAAARWSAGQEPPAPKKELPLGEFRPRSSLRTPDRTPLHAKFPVIDVHTHFRVRTRQSPEMLRDYVAVMNRQNVAVCVSLDGGIGDLIDEHRRHLEEENANRFLVFANLDFRGKGNEKDPATWDCNRADF